MAAKNNTEVIIDGKVYTLSGYESQAVSYTHLTLPTTSRV